MYIKKETECFLYYIKKYIVYKERIIVKNGHIYRNEYIF